MTSSPPTSILLASASPRRRELLALTGLPFEVRAAAVDESQRPGEAPADYVRRVAREKATAVAQDLAADLGPAAAGRLVVAADTTVVLDGQTLGKPGDGAEAREMLTRLRGRTHEVLSAVVVLDPASGRMGADFCRSQVPMRRYSDAEIADYVRTGDPLDKAGAYAIQNGRFRPVEDFQHCFASVMGLPLCHLVRALRRFGVGPPADVPAACQNFNHYPCPVYGDILAEAPSETSGVGE